MSDDNENEKETENTPSPPSPESAPPPPEAPPPPPPPETPPPTNTSGNVTREEFQGVAQGLTKLTETVGALVDKLAGPDSKPVSIPWIYRGGGKYNNG